MNLTLDKKFVRTQTNVFLLLFNAEPQAWARLKKAKSLHCFSSIIEKYFL